MPMPKPNSNEDKEKFVSRFMENEEMMKEYPDEKQRLAIAFSEWDKRNKKENDLELENKKYDSINFKPTDSMAKAAKRGLKMREEQSPSNRGGTSVGLARARQLVNKETLSPDTVKRMYSFFSRHEVDKQSESWKKGNSKGEQAWLLWGGDPGFSWSKRIVGRMKKEDEKKEGDNLGNMEHKEMRLDIIEVKQEGNKGYFKAWLNKYGNVDYGNDRTMPSFGAMNNGKQIPLLKQHQVGTEHGMLTILHKEEGMMVDGELYLEKIENTEIPVFPTAHETYSLLKRGAKGGVPVQFSMGYNVTSKEYKNENGTSIRELTGGEVKEGSRVTFAMNPDSLQTNEVKGKGGADVEEKEIMGLNSVQRERRYGMMNMEEMMQKRNMMDQMMMMKNIFNESCDNCLMMTDMDMGKRMEMLRKNLMYMMENYPKMAEDYMKAYGEDMEMMKSDMEKLESKSKDEPREVIVEVKEEYDIIESKEEENSEYISEDVLSKIKALSDKMKGSGE